MNRAECVEAIAIGDFGDRDALVWVIAISEPRKHATVAEAENGVLMARRTRNEDFRFEGAQFLALDGERRKENVSWFMFMTDPTRADRWVAAFKEVCDRLASSPTEDAAARFWVLCYGALVEIAHAHQPYEFVPPSVQPDPNGTDEQRTAWVDQFNREREADVLRICKEMRAEFLSDELMLIEWKRDDESHVYLSGYELKARNGTLNTRRESALLGSVSLEDFGRVTVAWFNERDKVGVAAALARRAAPYVARIIAVLDSFEVF